MNIHKNIKKLLTLYPMLEYIHLYTVLLYWTFIYPNGLFISIFLFLFLLLFSQYCRYYKPNSNFLCASNYSGGHLSKKNFRSGKSVHFRL